jgi:plasmid stabilization system protein ParE
VILLSAEAVSDIQRVRDFLQESNPEAAQRAMATIWAALHRVEHFPYLGRPTTSPEIRQIVVPFGRRGYIIRYRILPEEGAILVTRIWHARERRD